MKTDADILDEIEESWEDAQCDNEIELSPKAINWLIEKARERVGHV